MAKTGTLVRLQRFLSQAGVAARRKAEQLIVDGVVAVNGEVVTVLGTKVDPQRDRVTVNGETVVPEALFYAVLNKPKGCITAVSDPEGRPTVMEYLHKVPVRVTPVGRLDFYTEGVLLLTNDGELSAALQSPKNHVEKTYHAKLRGRIREGHLDRMRRGVRLDDGAVTRRAQVDRLASKSSHDWLVITLTEGKSRQIHRMTEALGYQVTKLQRVAFAGISFHGLRVGDARELERSEVDELCALVGLPTRGRREGGGKWRVQREKTERGRRAAQRLRKSRSSEAEPESSAVKVAPQQRRRVQARPGNRRGTGARRAKPRRR